MDDTEYAYVAIHGKPDHECFYFFNNLPQIDKLVVYIIYIYISISGFGLVR